MNTPGNLKEKIEGIEHNAVGIGTFGWIIFGTVMAQILVMFFLNTYQVGQVENIERQKAEIKQTLGSEEYATINNQLDQVISGVGTLSLALENRTRWSNLYGRIAAITPRDVSIASFSVDEDGAFRADGQTVNMSSLARLLVAWRDGTQAATTPFAEINLASNAYSVIGNRRIVTFSMTGQLSLGEINRQ